MDIRRVRADFTNDGDRVRQADKLRFENDNCIGERGSKVRAAGILIKAGVCSAALALVSGTNGVFQKERVSLVSHTSIENGIRTTSVLSNSFLAKRLRSRERNSRSTSLTQ